jgi:ATP-dependent DNA ligase
MLTETVRSPALPPRSAAEPKWDGFRAALSIDGDQVVLLSRRGTQMAPAFPEVVSGTAQLPDATALDGVM